MTRPANKEKKTPLKGGKGSTDIDNFISEFKLELNRKYTYRPSAEQINQEIATKACGEHLGDNIQVGYQGRL